MGGKKVFELRLEIGHKSTPFNRKLANGYTHKWTAFVRGANNSKIEHCIQRVVFQLHESFDKPYREISEPPFQIKETGYAGFEIPIQIYFKNKDKPNHLVFVHDLCLLTNKPNDSLTTEKIKFINPNKEFEKCLIKSGAQMLSSTVKKERSDSPPAKKQKSSSLIPSKDMSKQPPTPQSQLSQSQSQSQSSHQLQQQPQPHQHHHHHHHHHHNHHHSSSQKSSQHNQSYHVNRDQPATKPIQTPQPAATKPKPSRDFIDMFGAPLVFNSQTKQNAKEEPIKEDSLVSGNDLQQIQIRISSLSDSERLQKIVDIVEEAGEWYNLTSKKFEFDLKRLDKKTLSKIERCLQH